MLYIPVEANANFDLSPTSKPRCRLFNDNLMQPCPIIDNPEEFRQHIQDVGAVPQYEGADGYLKFGDQLDSLAKEWEKYAINIWDEEGYGDQYTAEHKCYTCGGK